jgi:hypothetical protein
VAVALDLHVLARRDRARSRDAAEVVAPEVHEHHVLGALLGVGEQVARLLEVLLDRVRARPRAGDRALPHGAAGHGHERLRRGARDLEVLEVEEVHVRARVDGAQAAVDRERVHGAVGAPPLARHHLVDVARADVLLGPLYGRGVAAGAQVGRELRRLAPPGGRLRHRSAQALAHVRDGRRGLLVGALDVSVVREGAGGARTGAFAVQHHVRQHRDLVAKVVEGEQDVRDHHGQLRHACVVGVRLADRRLRAPREVVAEHPHGAAGERRQPVQRGDPVAGELLVHQPVRVRVLAAGEPDHGARPEAEERPAPDLLALLGRLE